MINNKTYVLSPENIPFSLHIYKYVCACVRVSGRKLQVIFAALDLVRYFIGFAKKVLQTLPNSFGPSTAVCSFLIISYRSTILRYEYVYETSHGYSVRSLVQ